MIKNPPADAEDIGDVDSIPGSGKSPGARHGNPLQFSCLENPMDRKEPGRLQSIVSQSQTQMKRFSTRTTVHQETG